MLCRFLSSIWLSLRNQDKLLDPAGITSLNTDVDTTVEICTYTIAKFHGITSIPWDIVQKISKTSTYKFSFNTRTILNQMIGPLLSSQDKWVEKRHTPFSDTAVLCGVWVSGLCRLMCTFFQSKVLDVFSRCLDFIVITSICWKPRIKGTNSTLLNKTLHGAILTLIIKIKKPASSYCFIPLLYCWRTITISAQSNVPQWTVCFGIQLFLYHAYTNFHSTNYFHFQNSLQCMNVFSEVQKGCQSHTRFLILWHGRICTAVFNWIGRICHLLLMESTFSITAELLHAVQLTDEDTISMNLLPR